MALGSAKSDKKSKIRQGQGVLPLVRCGSFLGPCLVIVKELKRQTIKLTQAGFIKQVTWKIHSPRCESRATPKEWVPPHFRFFMSLFPTPKQCLCKTQNSGLCSKEEKPRDPINQPSRCNTQEGLLTVAQTGWLWSPGRQSTPNSKLGKLFICK